MDGAMDRRNFDRLKNPRFLIEYKIDGSNSIYEVEIINISAGGICFLRKSIINKNDIIQIKFPFKSRKVILSGKVLRIDGKEVAVKFLNRDDEIERFVKVFNKEYPYLKEKSIKGDGKLYSIRLGKKVEKEEERDYNDMFNIDGE